MYLYRLLAKPVYGSLLAMVSRCIGIQWEFIIIICSKVIKCQDTPFERTNIPELLNMLILNYKKKDLTNVTSLPYQQFQKKST